MLGPRRAVAELPVVPLHSPAHELLLLARAQQWSQCVIDSSGLRKAEAAALAVAAAASELLNFFIFL